MRAAAAASNLSDLEMIKVGKVGPGSSSLHCAGEARSCFCVVGVEHQPGVRTQDSAAVCWTVR